MLSGSAIRIDRPTKPGSDLPAQWEAAYNLTSKLKPKYYTNLWGYLIRRRQRNFLHPPTPSLMSPKRRQSFETPTKESPKKHNTGKTLQQTPQKPSQNKVPPGTPTRYGITAADASSLVDRIDTFSTLIKCVALVVENCGGSYEEDRNLGSHLIDAVNAVTVWAPSSSCANY